MSAMPPTTPPTIIPVTFDLSGPGSGDTLGGVVAGCVTTGVEVSSEATSFGEEPPGAFDEGFFVKMEGGFCVKVEGKGLVVNVEGGSADVLNGAAVCFSSV